MAVITQTAISKTRDPHPCPRLHNVVALREMWRDIFDSNTTAARRKEIISEIREFVDFGRQIKPGSAASQLHYLGYVDLESHERVFGTEKIPESTVVVGIMARGLNTAGYYYSQLSDMGLSQGHLGLIGFSSGMYPHGESKTFSDGTSMYGKVYVLHEDLKAMMDGNSVTFVDHCPPQTRTTLVAIGRALIQLGYDKPIFELDNNGYVREWVPYVIRNPTVKLPKKIPIITEQGSKNHKLLTAARLAARK